MPVECAFVLNKHRNDGKIDDVTVINGIRRAPFRLHHPAEPGAIHQVARLSQGATYIRRTWDEAEDI